MKLATHLYVELKYEFMELDLQFLYAFIAQRIMEELG